MSLPWLLRDCHRRRCPLWRSFREVCLPLFWGFRVVVYMQLCGDSFFPFGCFVIRRFGGAGNACGNNSHVLRRRHDQWSCSSSGRALASSCNLGVHLLLPLVRWLLVEGFLHSPVTKITGRSLYGLICNFLFIQGCLCKSCIVNLYSYM